MPLQSKCPMFEVNESTLRPSPSMASAKNSRSSSQKSWLTLRFSSAAWLSKRLASSGSSQNSRARRAAAHLGVVDIALNLTRRARQARERAIGEQDGVPGILPALVLQSRLLVAAAVLNIALPTAVTVCVDPGRGSPGFHPNAPGQLRVAG